MKTIWILSDGLPGHYNQSIGLSNAIQSHFDHKAIMVDIKLRYKVLRPLMRFIANNIPLLIGEKLFSFFYKHSDIPSEKPSLIISAGGNTLFANIAMSVVYRVNNIFSGTLKGYKSHFLSTVFTVVPIKGINNNVVLDLPPTNINAHLISIDQPYYTLLIGGDGAGYSYTNADWMVLAEAIAEIAHRDNITWKITTSRRTGQVVEEKLKKTFDNTIISEAIWFSSNPKKVVKRFLDEGKVIFCTEDSLTMVSEAIYAQKPVVTLQPKVMKPEKNDNMALNKYQKRQFIIRTSIIKLSYLWIDKEMFCQNYPDVQKQITNAVAPLL